MCGFISWIEHDGRLYYLTREQLDSEKGKELAEYCGSPKDLVGHGAIRKYYGFSAGFNRECINFSTPDNFPTEIVSALKKGLFYGMGTPTAILTPEASKQYLKTTKPAWEEYEEIEQKIAWEEYWKIIHSEKKKCYEGKCQTLGDHKRIAALAWEKYKEMQHPAWEKYKEIDQKSFWNLFKDPNNRIECWR